MWIFNTETVSFDLQNIYTNTILANVNILRIKENIMNPVIQ